MPTRAKAHLVDTVNPPSFEKIVVPRDWTGVQDIQACIDSFGEVDDYFDVALCRVAAGYDKLERSLDDMLITTGNGRFFTAHIMQRIDALRQHFSTWPPTKAYCDRFLENLTHCRFTLVEYFRIVPGYPKGGDLNWLFPLVRLADHLIEAGTGLRAGLQTHPSAADLRNLRKIGSVENLRFGQDSADECRIARSRSA